MYDFEQPKQYNWEKLMLLPTRSNGNFRLILNNRPGLSIDDNNQPIWPKCRLTTISTTTASYILRLFDKVLY
jgi:hypothetical protein